MLQLIPEWAHHYGEFWRAIRVRNLWLIKSRYFAGLMLIGFLVFGETILDFNLTNTQIRAIIIIVISIFLYNVIIHSGRKYAGTDPNKFNCLHLSLIQIVLDLISLMVLVYYTGVMESPLYMFFIFHMIIGSLILPGFIVYINAGIVSISFSIIAMLQHFGIVENHFIHGLYTSSRPHTLTYDILFVIVFTLMLFISVYFANRIARQLYLNEQHLRSTLERLHEAEITKQKYIIGIIHEIKTPIVAIQSILELLLKHYVGPISEEIEKKLKRALVRTNETIKLLYNILRISKLKILDIRTTEEIKLEEFIQTIINKQLEAILAKEVDISYEDKRIEKRVIKSDIILLDLALSNIIANAIKYVKYNGKVLIILSDVEDMVSIEICDNGIGIPRKEFDKIFEQFYRASNIDKTQHEGSGMGLAISKEIIERLGGTIIVNSPSRIGDEENPGTSFEIRLKYKFKPTPYDIFEVNDQDYLMNKSNF